MDRIDLEQLTGTTSRTYITRKVSDGQVNRPVHIAIAMWEQRWDSAPSGEVSGWAIAVDAQPVRGPKVAFVRAGQTKERDPNPHVMREINRALKTLQRGHGDAWVVVGRRRGQLRLELEKAGYDVTGSFSEKNRAGKRASGLRKKHKAACERKARATGEAPKNRVRNEVATTETHWLPNYSRTQGRSNTLRISCDASSDTQTKGSMCFVAANGDYQLKTVATKASTDELELETITLALKYLRKTGVRTAHIETDSAAAIEAVEQLLRGQATTRKRWRGLSPGSRSRFRQAWTDLQGQCEVTISRVLGHAGDPLNKAADKIAYMALRATAHPKAQAQETLVHGIERALADAAHP